MNQNAITMLHSKALLLDAFELLNHALWTADDKPEKRQPVKSLDHAEACVDHLEKAG